MSSDVCQQCAKPVCLAVCPVEAIDIVADKTVRIGIKNKCIGCGKCVSACPEQAILLVDKAAVKCDLCFYRRSAGQDPACVQACPMFCLIVS